MKIIAHLFFILLLTSCASPYQKKGLTGGYEDQSLGGDRWRISVKGNAFTSIEKIKEYFYLRAKELSQENGYDGYVVEIFESGRGYYGGSFGGLVKPWVRGTIRCYTGKKPATKNSQQK